MEYGLGDVVVPILTGRLDPRDRPQEFKIVKIELDKNAYFLRDLGNNQIHLEPKEILNAQYRKIRYTQ